MPKTEYVIDPGKYDIVMTRVFDAPRELVFKAYTDPQLFAQWWGRASTQTGSTSSRRAEAASGE
jgi:uncharacterized protein YndB with AHSA1/START domain